MSNLKNEKIKKPFNYWRRNQLERYKGTILDCSIASNFKQAYIVDGVMGYGKTTAAINFINDQPNHVKIMYITPYLDEVERITKSCPSRKFTQPTTKNQNGRKIDSLYNLIKEGKNIVCTHALFKTLDIEGFNLAKINNYILIMDEVADVIEDSGINKQDIRMLLGMTREGDIEQRDKPIIKINDEGIAEWIDYNYKGVLADKYKKMIDLGCLFKYGNQQLDEEEDYEDDIEELIENNQEQEDDKKSCPSMLIWNYPIKIYEAFSKVFILTYMFEGQIQCGYYKLHNLPYKYIHIKKEMIKINNGEDCVPDYNFIPELFDAPQNFDLTKYQKLIHIEDNFKMNSIGEKTVFDKKQIPLSKHWYTKHPELLDVLKKRTSNYFNNITRFEGDGKYRMWTTFKSYENKLKSKGYIKGFVPLNARATNKHKDKYILAYLVNRYPSPAITKFLQQKGVSIDEDKFALSEMLQWIFRSRIREEDEIWIYIPSFRMRNLLKVWMGLEPEEEW